MAENHEMTVQELGRKLRTQLYQGQEAMIKLGWTFSDLQWSNTLDQLEDLAQRYEDLRR